ncbi:hypothetical protein [Fodinibius sp.]|uniref:hypothetical protein n=1 Tax=Fodinibius sp. TaxID=1872440 RepID=UPI002ACEC2C7|nr:hypothetical protein [Fodinibius sp.]MDZ7659039.1 hypothetical protein [Fodinibius sp.]
MAIVLIGHSLVQGQPLMEKRSAVFLPVEKESGQATNPLAQPNLFNVYFPVESGISITNIPGPFLSGEELGKSEVHKVIASVADNRACVFLQIYYKVDRTPILLKYIFPFHSFL